MYEELIQKLRFCGNGRCSDTCPNWGEDTGEICQEALHIEAASAIEELQMKISADNAAINGMRRELDRCTVRIVELSKPHWISVEERLPEQWEPVLVTYLGYNSHLPKADMLAYIDSDDGSWYWWDDTEPFGTKCIVTITHWMPLPEPPKEET